MTEVGEDTIEFTLNYTYNIIQNNNNGDQLDFCILIWKIKAIPIALHFV